VYKGGASLFFFLYYSPIFLLPPVALLSTPLTLVDEENALKRGVELILENDVIYVKRE
jgi:hypothetical protein